MNQPHWKAPSATHLASNFMARKKKIALGEKKHFSRTFQSVRELLEYVRVTPRIAGEASTRENGTAFSGVENWQAAEKLATEGWHEGASKLKAGMTKAVSSKAGARLLKKRTVRKYDVSGDECDVALYCAGEAENMATTHRVITKGKTVKILRCAVSFSCGVTSQCIERYAVAVACAVQRIEASGHRVELWAMENSSQAPCGLGTPTEGVVFSMATKIKSADSRLHPAQLAFACHPAFLRRLAFAVLEREKGVAEILCAAGGKYGFCCTLPELTGFLTSAQGFNNNADVDKAIRELQRAA